MSTHDYAAAADAVESLLPKLARKPRGDCLAYTAGFLREQADQAKRDAVAEAEVDALAERLAFVWRDAAPFPDGNEWRAVACEAMAAAKSNGPQISLGFDFRTIPADATGLKGRRARIVGPVPVMAYGHSLAPGEVTIDGKAPDGNGNIWVVGACTDGRQRTRLIAASSLALIPDEPEPVPEPPVGTRLRDRDGSVWEFTDEGFWVLTSGLVAYRWVDLARAFGPLHQVWTDLDEVPKGTRFRCADGLVALRTGVPASSVPRTAAASPFIAVAEFGADQ